MYPFFQWICNTPNQQIDKQVFTLHFICSLMEKRFGFKWVLAGSGRGFLDTGSSPNPARGRD
jgi:hypothetical protein